LLVNIKILVGIYSVYGATNPTFDATKKKQGKKAKKVKDELKAKEYNGF